MSGHWEAIDVKMTGWAGTSNSSLNCWCVSSRPSRFGITRPRPGVEMSDCRQFAAHLQDMGRAFECSWRCTAADECSTTLQNASDAEGLGKHFARVRTRAYPMQLSQTALPAHVVDPLSHLWPMNAVVVSFFAIPAPSGRCPPITYQSLASARLARASSCRGTTSSRCQSSNVSASAVLPSCEERTTSHLSRRSSEISNVSICEQNVRRDQARYHRETGRAGTFPSRSAGPRSGKVT